MNGQYQEIPELRQTIPEERKHQIIVLLGRMIHHRLSEHNPREETTARTGLESPVWVRHAEVR
jgi:hypothetical protein